VQHQRQPPPIKIPKFKEEHDPNAYMEWEQKVDQFFSIHRVSDQEQVDLVVLEFEEYAMTWWYQICMDNYNQEPLVASWMDQLLPNSCKEKKDFKTPSKSSQDPTPNDEGLSCFLLRLLNMA